MALHGVGSREATRTYTVFPYKCGRTLRSFIVESSPSDFQRLRYFCDGKIFRYILAPTANNDKQKVNDIQVAQRVSQLTSRDPPKRQANEIDSSRTSQAVMFW